MRVREAREAGMHQEGEGKSDQYNRLVKALAGTLLGEALEGGPLPGGEVRPPDTPPAMSSRCAKLNRLRCYPVGSLHPCSRSF